MMEFRCIHATCMQTLVGPRDMPHPCVHCSRRRWYFRVTGARGQRVKVTILNANASVSEAADRGSSDWRGGSDGCMSAIED